MKFAERPSDLCRPRKNPDAAALAAAKAAKAAGMTIFSVGVKDSGKVNHVMLLLLNEHYRWRPGQPAMPSADGWHVMAACAANSIMPICLQLGCTSAALQCVLRVCGSIINQQPENRRNKGNGAADMLCVILQASDNTLNPTLLRAVASRAQFFFTVSDFRSLSSAVQSIMPKVCTGAVH